jgi:hypothetical protein
MVRFDRRVVRDFAHWHGRGFRQYLRQLAFMFRVKMLNQDKRHSRFGRQMLNESREGF